MEYISLPEKCVKLELRREYHSSFYVNDENIIVQPLEKYITHVLKQIKKHKGRERRSKVIFPQKIEGSWLGRYYRLIEKKESSFKSRFLGKELLFRRILLHCLYPQKDIFGRDKFLNRLIEDSDYPYIKELLDIVENNKENIVFFTKNFKEIKEVIKLTPLEFHQLMLSAFPFELKSYKFWIENVLLYNIHNELTII